MIEMLAIFRRTTTDGTIVLTLRPKWAGKTDDELIAEIDERALATQVLRHWASWHERCGDDVEVVIKDSACARIYDSDCEEELYL